MPFFTKPALCTSMLLAALSLPVQAATYNFNCFEGCERVPAGLGGQLAVEVLDNLATAAVNDVLFKFTNAVGYRSSIDDLYFDNGLTGLLSGISLQNKSAGVKFKTPAKPGNVPGGHNISFFSDFSAGRTNGAAYGIDADGEYLTVRAKLSGDHTFSDVVHSLNTGALRVALHVQGIGTGDYSAGYVNAVPEPETWATLIAGLGLLGLKLRRRAGSHSC